MARHSFIQMSKLPNVKGRISYITSHARQENLIREHDMPPKPTLRINMAEFRTMRDLMIRVQDEARVIRNLQDSVLPKMKTQLAEWKLQVKEKRRPQKPSERESVRNRLRQLQKQGRQQPHRKKSFDRDS